jgi:hypothetical protein
MKLLSLFVLLSTVNAYAAEIYRCQDEEGNIEYTQIPSPTCREEVKLPPTTTSSTKNAAPVSSQTTLEEDCKIARQNLAILNSKDQVKKPDQNNPDQFIILNDEMRQQEKAHTQAYINKYCTKLD